jgi:D-methionine transport system substrate-binding protein
MTESINHFLSRAFNMSSLLRLLAASTLAIAFAAPAQAEDKNTITVGISVGTAEKIFDVVQKVAARDGLVIKLVKFNDYQLPNAALNAGDLDANAFQHKPFLDNQIKARGFDIVPAGLTVTAPLGFYSRKIKSLNDLPEGASVGIQNDPSNGNRALRLLAAYKIITLKPEAEQKNTATPLDVVSNPRKIKLVALDAAQLPRSLDDLTAASINNDYAEQAGLVPARDAIGREAADGPYANLIAVRTKDRDQPWVKQLVAAYQSPEVRAYIEKEFKGSLIPAF